MLKRKIEGDWKICLTIQLHYTCSHSTCFTLYQLSPLGENLKELKEKEESKVTWNLFLLT